MARGLATPMPVIVIGVIGGTIALGSSDCSLAQSYFRRLGGGGLAQGSDVVAGGTDSRKGRTIQARSRPTVDACDVCLWSTAPPPPLAGNHDATSLA
jgi:hypothetical protein